MKTSLFLPRQIPSILLLLLLQAGQSPATLSAQSSSEAEASGEALELSPFVVSSSEDRGYAVAGTRLAGPRFQTGLTVDAPRVPVTIIRRADAVVIEFALSNSADKQDARNQELTASVELLAQAIKALPGLRFENREVQLATGNRSHSIIGKGGVVTSFANFAVFAGLGDDVRLYERVKQVRNLVATAKLKGDTKSIDGPVSLFIKRPNETRGELLAKIFADLEVVKKGLGVESEVLVSGLSGPVQLRTCSENEIELWLDYSFTIRSRPEMESRRPVKL